MRPAAGGAQDIFQPRSNKVPLPLIERAQGIFQWDEYGNEYIDVSSGPVVSNIGHGNAHVAEAMARQARTMDFAYARVARHRPNIDLTARIATLAGPGFERVCLSSGGSEAIEIAIKFLRAHAVAFGEPSRTKVITCQPSYHGGTIAGLGIVRRRSAEAVPRWLFVDRRARAGAAQLSPAGEPHRGDLVAGLRNGARRQDPRVGAARPCSPS